MPIKFTEDQEKALKEVIIYIRLCKLAYKESNPVFKELWAKQNLEQNTIKRIENILGIPLDNQETDDAIWVEVNKRFEKLKEDTYAKSLGEQHKSIANDLKKLFPLSREETVAFGKVALISVGVGATFWGIKKIFGGKKKKTGD